MGRHRLRAELYSLHRSIRGDAAANSLCGSPVRVVADRDCDFPLPQPHPVHRRILSRAAYRGTNAVDVSVCGSVQRVLLELFVGDLRRLHRHSDRYGDGCYAQPVSVLSLVEPDPLWSADGMTRAFGWAMATPAARSDARGPTQRRLIVRSRPLEIDAFRRQQIERARRAHRKRVDIKVARLFVRRLHSRRW